MGKSHVRLRTQLTKSMPSVEGCTVCRHWAVFFDKGAILHQKCFFIQFSPITISKSPKPFAWKMFLKTIWNIQAWFFRTPEKNNKNSSPEQNKNHQISSRPTNSSKPGRSAITNPPVIYQLHFLAKTMSSCRAQNLGHEKTVFFCHLKPS